MTTRIVVIGKDDKNKTTSPIERTLLEISQCMDKPIRLFVCTPKETYQYDSDEKKPNLRQTYTVVKDTLSTLVSSKEIDCKLLLFDAASISGEFRPIIGLSVWVAAFEDVSGVLQTSFIFFPELLDTFFCNDDSGICWSGLVKPTDFKINTLLDQERTKSIMAGLIHRKGGRS